MREVIKAKGKLLFTPGPLTTSRTVKEAMLVDLGSRDCVFIDMVAEIRNRLLELGEVSKQNGYEAILMQGAGTFGVESVITSVIPENGHLLVITNGAYGERMVKMADIGGIKYSSLKYAENETPAIRDVEGLLKNEPSITHVAVVHCETTTGIVNPIKRIGELVNKAGKVYIVDAMSSFGGIPISIEDCHIDFLVSSANKCIEGVPGFSFVIARRASLQKIAGHARTLSLDLYAQWQGLEQNGQFRFTPPTHTLTAFYRALKELELEGGINGRANRYRANHETLVNGMREFGFKEYLDRDKQGYIITAFNYPAHPDFNFERFYELLNEQGFVIYPGKLSKVDCFRIGNIGHIFPEDIHNLLSAIQVSLKEMGISFEIPVNS